MKPKLITERDRIRTVADRWYRIYSGASWGEFSYFGTWKKLSALDLETATAKDVADIIGNSSWTALLCDGCDEYRDAVVCVGRRVDGERTSLCRDCIAEALGEF